MAYKPSYHITLGLAPTRRDGFPSPKDAFENKKRVLPKLREILAGIPDVEVVDIEWLNDEGLLVDPMDVPRVAEYFKSRKVDAVFMPHCNYGSEEVVGMLGKAMEKPFLLWGPRDEAPPSGCVNRYTDTQCGLFGSSAALIAAETSLLLSVISTLITKYLLTFLRGLHILTVRKLMFPFFEPNLCPLAGGRLVFFIAAQRGQTRYAAQLYLH